MGTYPQNSDRGGYLHRGGNRNHIMHAMNTQGQEPAYLPRQVKLIVIHCSATRCNASFSLTQLEQCHQTQGFNAIGYHFYITRNGQLHTTRPLDQPGAHARGFNRHSIGICYEGGLNRQGIPTDTRTRWQKNSLADLLAALRRLYPQAQVKGHYQLGANIGKACPCFDAESEYNQTAT